MNDRNAGRGRRVPWWDVVFSAIAAVSWALIGMAGTAALGLRLLEADTAGELGPMTAAVVALGAGGPVTLSGDVSVLGLEEARATTAIEITPPGVGLVGALVLSWFFLRSLRGTGVVVPTGELLARAGAVLALFAALMGGLAWAGKAVVTLDGGRLGVGDGLPGGGGALRASARARDGGGTAAVGVVDRGVGGCLVGPVRPRRVRRGGGAAGAGGDGVGSGRAVGRRGGGGRSAAGLCGTGGGGAGVAVGTGGRGWRQRRGRARGGVGRRDPCGRLPGPYRPGTPYRPPNPDTNPYLRLPEELRGSAGGPGVPGVPGVYGASTVARRPPPSPRRRGPEAGAWPVPPPPPEERPPPPPSPPPSPPPPPPGGPRGR